jgi:hypothetical protein
LIARIAAQMIILKKGAELDKKQKAPGKGRFVQVCAIAGQA